jgi:hypothetical protein
MHIHVQLPVPFDISSKGWYAVLYVKSRAGTTLDTMYSQYNDTTPSQQLVFPDRAEATVLQIEYYRYSVFGDEKVGCRHFPLLDAHFDRKSVRFETYVKDMTNDQNQKYDVAVEIGEKGQKSNPNPSSTTTAVVQF